MHGVHFTTLYAWRRRLGSSGPTFVEVQIPQPPRDAPHIAVQLLHTADVAEMARVWGAVYKPQQIRDIFVIASLRYHSDTTFPPLP